MIFRAFEYIITLVTPKAVFQNNPDLGDKKDESKMGQNRGRKHASAARRDIASKGETKVTAREILLEVMTTKLKPLGNCKIIPKSKVKDFKFLPDKTYLFVRIIPKGIVKSPEINGVSIEFVRTIDDDSILLVLTI